MSGEGRRITSATPPRYRKTKEGEWAIFGPAGLIVAGKVARVLKKDGSYSDELVARVSKPFEVDGVQCVYGYLDREARGRSGGGGGSDRNRYAGYCHECRTPVAAGAGVAYYCDGDANGCMEHFDGGWAILCRKHSQ